MWGIFCSCSIEPSSRKPVTPSERNNIYQMLYFASLAGSSHNSQPWKVEVQDNRLIRLYADTTRELSVVDPERRELYISMGAFIENLTLAAGSLGYKCDIKFNDSYQNSAFLAEIYLEKTSPTGLDLSLIEKRRTLRNPFKTISITEKDVEQIISPDSQCIHFFSASSKEGKFISQKTIEAYTQQAFRKDAQVELAQWIRFSDKDVNEKKDGLTTAGMQIDGISGFFVRHFMKPEDSKKASFVKSGIEKTKKQALNCGGWIVITSSDNLVADWIKIGRLYEHINLICTELHIGFQPINQIIEEPNFKTIVTDYLNLNGQLMFVARVGYVTQNPAPVSPRRPVAEFSKFNH